MYGASVNYKGYRLHADLTGISKRQLGGPFSINMFVGLPEDVEVTAATPTKDNPYFAGTPEAIITEMTVTPDLLAVCWSTNCEEVPTWRMLTGLLQYALLASRRNYRGNWIPLLPLAPCSLAKCALLHEPSLLTASVAGQNVEY